MGDGSPDANAVPRGVGVRVGGGVLRVVGVRDGMSVGARGDANALVEVEWLVGAAVGEKAGNGFCAGALVPGAEEHPCNKNKPANRKARRNAESE